MVLNDRLPRRSVIRQLAGVSSAAGVAAVAGCTEGTGEGEEEADGREGDPVDEAEDDADPADTGWEDDWEDVETIELEATTDDGWIGRQPAPIEGEANPDLALYEGQEYDLVWTNADGDVHNFAIWDDDGEPLVSSDFLEEEDETTEFVLEATDEMDVYLCETHDSEMHGSIEVRSE